MEPDFARSATGTAPSPDPLTAAERAELERLRREVELAELERLRREAADAAKPQAPPPNRRRLGRTIPAVVLIVLA